jgi:hypothetical protein
MKISKITIVIVGVVVLGAASGLLYMQHSKQQQEQNELRAKIAANQATASRLTAERDNWQSQLTKLQGQLEQKKMAVTAANMSLSAARAEWSRDAESIEYDEILFGLADGWSLKVDSASAGEPAVKPVQGIGFTNTAFSVTVSGKPLAEGFDERQKYEDYIYQVVDNILGFVNSVSKDKSFASAKIDLVNLTVPTLLTSDEIIGQGTNLPQPSATITVTVYTYRGG